ncbi:hypothetical protein H072_847 [Dactylellina haptotyla CBS 200.50]|uniref:AB hydrolase-1 domain-containing protein n=1 Tax=Dactylellina haptotyla (strain CBS 200.50) TaxID=1284197 RepID=S8AW43_DACHA|nr:hypothetical protein H072_847 [Dactylellina haptotyla CBS 200.50]
MAAQPPPPSPAFPPNAQSLSISLPHKPSAALSCTFIESTASSTLVVFLNGLGLPQSHWWPCITHYLNHSATTTPNHPAFLTYDRYGQGLTTDPDPQDSDTTLPEGHRHDITSVTHDLHGLLEFITTKNHHPYSLAQTTLILAANSIGCPIARYYAQLYPGTVSGLLLLDSYMTDTTFVDLYPDPDAPQFDPSSLPEDVTVDDIRAARTGMGKLFHPKVVNKEGFWRGTITSLLPHSYEPKLLAPLRPMDMNDEPQPGPYLTVIGHDWDLFAEESIRMPGMTRAVAMNYTNPAWGQYNDGLLKITTGDKSKGLIAKGAGHFVQRDRPDLVAEELARVVQLVKGNE